MPLYFSVIIPCKPEINSVVEFSKEDHKLLDVDKICDTGEICLYDLLVSKVLLI